MCGSKQTLGGPINYRTLNSYSIIAELKHTLMHKCTSFSASMRFHRFLMFARFAFTGYHKTVSNKISSDRISYYVDGLMQSIHSVLCRKPKLFSSQGLGYPIPYHTLIQCGKLPCLNTLMGSVRYLTILLG